MKYFIVARLTVSDFNQFKSEFDAAHELLQKWGFSRTWVNRNVDDPNQLVIVHETQDLSKAREFYKSQDYMQCIRKAGITGTPEILFLEELIAMPQIVTA